MTAAITREEAGRLMRLASNAAVAAALLMIGMKFYAYLATGSVSLLSTLFDSALDIAASLVNLLAVRHALMPADAEHRAGQHHRGGHHQAEGEGGEEDAVDHGGLLGVHRCEPGFALM